MKQICMRCKHGKGYFVGNSILFIGKEGSFAVDTKGVILDFPEGTMKYCPWCGKKLCPTEKGGAE